jgi:hypothetical protein
MYYLLNTVSKRIINMINGIKTATSALKTAQLAGKELGAIIEIQQADMEATVQREHKSRINAKLSEQKRQSTLEFRALERFEHKLRYEQEVATLKANIIKKYGKDAWAKVEAEKTQLEKDRNTELSAMERDRQKQIDVLCWCFTVGALITFFLKLYKI